MNILPPQRNRKSPPPTFNHRTQACLRCGEVMEVDPESGEAYCAICDVPEE